jgi:hypothetical protein
MPAGGGTAPPAAGQGFDIRIALFCLLSLLRNAPASKEFVPGDQGNRMKFQE